MIIENDSEFSTLFRPTDGVRQGGAISPRLFAIYIEELIKNIETKQLGVKLGRISVDLILYADDIVLLSDSKSKIQKMLDITGDFGRANEIKFNAGKTVFMLFNENLKSDLVIRMRVKHQIY
jgi:hypothetical protein